MMHKRILSFVVLLFLIGIFILFSIEESRTFMIALFMRIVLFLKHNIFELLAAFFLVKGKFILKLFLKKLAILSATGLGKRYVVEKVLMENLKIHFLDHLSYDIKRVVRHAKKNFQNFPLVKKMITIFAFLGSLGFVVKFMGGMIAVKVFFAKVWSFLLALFLKVGTAITYFFTDYLWGSWLAPIVEVIIFSWVLSWMEKVPFLAKGLRKIYAFFIFLFGWMEYYMEKVLHIPLKSFLKWLVKKIKESIDHFIEDGYRSIWSKVQEHRVHHPNRHMTLRNKRESRSVKRNKRKDLTLREMILQKRKTRNR